MLACAGLLGGSLFLGSHSASTLDPAAPNVTLTDVERGVEQKYSVPNISSAEAARMIASGDAVLFDVRERREFDAGHLPGAIHVDPGEPVDRFLANNAAKLRGRVGIFYCSVGVRSSQLLERVEQAVTPHHLAELYNLRGGIFRWFVEGRPVIDLTGLVNRIDPYNDSWGRLLQRALDTRG